MSGVIDQSEVYHVFGSPDWQARDHAGDFHAIDTRLLRDGMPFKGDAQATMIGTVRSCTNGKTFIPTKVSMVSKPRQR